MATLTPMIPFVLMCVIDPSAAPQENSKGCVLGDNPPVMQSRQACKATLRAHLSRDQTVIKEGVSALRALVGRDAQPHWSLRIVANCATPQEFEELQSDLGPQLPNQKAI